MSNNTDEKMIVPIVLNGTLDELFIVDNPGLQEAIEKVTSSSTNHLKAGEPLIETLIDNDSKNNYGASMDPRYQIPALFGVIEQLGDKLDAKILYVASSYGMSMKMISAAGYTNIQGIDVDEVAVDFCKKQGLNVHLMDASNTKFSDESFDVIASRDFLVKDYMYHDYIMVRFLNEQHRLLKKGGSAIFTTMAHCLSGRPVLDMVFPHEKAINQSKFSDSKKSQKFFEIRFQHAPNLKGAIYCVEIYEK